MLLEGVATIEGSVLQQIRIFHGLSSAVQHSMVTLAREEVLININAFKKQRDYTYKIGLQYGILLRKTKIN